MTNHHDEMRVAPDPSRAEELRQRLHARLASVPSADTDRDDREGDLMMLDTEDRPTGPVAPRHRSPGRWLLVAAAVAMVVVVGTVLVAVGNDDKKPLDTVTAPTTAPPHQGCPFTAAEVSEVIGQTVTGPESSTDCNFGEGFPSVRFAYLPASTCAQEPLTDPGGLEYSDAVDGLGVDAYSTPVSLGTSLLVCNGDQPFSVLVDGLQGDTLPLTAAVELAKLVQDG